MVEIRRALRDPVEVVEVVGVGFTFGGVGWFCVGGG